MTTPNEGHTAECESQHTEWSGSLCPDDPDNFWICDECDGRISAAPDDSDDAEP